MKYSIRKQFTIIFSLLMAGTILLLWFVNNTFLEKYYLREKQQALMNAYVLLNTGVSGNQSDTAEFDTELENIFGKYNISAIVLDGESSLLKRFFMDFMDAQIMAGQLVNNIFLGETGNYKQIIEESDKYTMWIVTDYSIQMDYVEIWGILDNGTYFLFRSAMEGIKDSVALANRFLAYVGLGAALLSGLIILIVTKKITDPIKELTAISQRMIHLDFEAQYQGKSKTEIALLGQNINDLSKSLENTISELKNANNELLRDLQHKNEIDLMRTEFLSNVSHELKTPIALIQGYAEGLLEGIHEDQENRDYYCEVIVDEAAKMNLVVKKLLTLNELEFGNAAISLERLDIAALINNYLQSIEILLKQRQINLLKPAAEPLYVWADEFKTEEVLGNYLTNGLNHVADGGTLKVEIGEHDRLVRVSVWNEGAAIPEESIPFIWDKFYKADKARTREYGGSGIGLSIVKAIMEGMNQKFGACNRDNGVEFWFELEKVSKYEQCDKQ